MVLNSNLEVTAFVRSYNVIIQQLSDAPRRVECTVLELLAAVVAACGAVTKVGSDDLLVVGGVGISPAGQASRGRR
jgi:hypothetical protein